MAKTRKRHQIIRLRGNGDPRGEDLTVKEALFVEAFVGPAQGDAFRAAQLAGYSTSSIGLSKVATPQVRRAIDARIAELDAVGAALTPLEIHAAWRRLSAHHDPMVQLRATENAAKARGMFVTRVDARVEVEDRRPGIAELDAFLSGLSEEELDALVGFIRARRDAPKRTVEVVDAGDDR
jgi:hypothetical protein